MVLGEPGLRPGERRANSMALRELDMEHLWLTYYFCDIHDRVCRSLLSSSSYTSMSDRNSGNSKRHSYSIFF